MRRVDLFAGVAVSPAAAAAEEAVERNDEVNDDGDGDDDDELELGLSLGAKKFAATEGMGPACRILTARDLPRLAQPRPAAAATSPDSSVSSSSAAAVASKRAKSEAGSTSPETVGSCHPPGYGVVGWPPIRAFRMNSLFSQSKDNPSETGAKKIDTSESDGFKDKEDENKGRTVGWVKVNMDGEVIGRKVDLNAHHSYKSLALALELMFTKPSIGLGAANGTKALNLLVGSPEFQLTYEDKDGDWMLVGDVPWEMFVDSVRRLRIMRTSDASGLAPRFQGLHRSPGLVRSKPS